MRRPLSSVAIVLALGAGATPARAQTAGGAALFDRHCATCHVGADIGRAPTRDALRDHTPESILGALVSGVMIVQGKDLNDQERRTIAEYLSGRTLGSDVAPPPIGRCASSPPLADPTKSPRWNGWGATLANTRFQPADQARLAADQVPRLRLKWAFGFPGASSARAQPAVAGGHVFVGSENGVVYALDARTGCTRWTFAARAGVRTAMTVARAGLRGATVYSVYFGDINAQVYSLDAATGELQWMRKVDDHEHARITGSPALDGDLLYVPVGGVGEEGAGSRGNYPCCTFRGSVVALEAATGAVRWKTYTIDEAPTPRGKHPQGQTAWGPSGASIWSAPTIDPKRRMLYVGTGNQFSGPQKRTSDAIIAMNLDSGQVKWVSQRTAGDISIGGCRDPVKAKQPNCPGLVGPDLDFASSPMLISLPDGRDLIIAGQKSGVTWALDPDNEGAVVWQHREGKGGPMGGIQWGTATDGEQTYLAIADDQSSIYQREGDTPGGLHALRLATGEHTWFAPPRPLKCDSGPGCSAAQSSAITVIPGVVFSGSIDGAIRGFSTRDGAMIWEFDTNREFETVNGVKAKGASIGGPGPVVVNGMLYVNSGYSTGGRPGNVLLAFEAGTP